MPDCLQKLDEICLSWIVDNLWNPVWNLIVVLYTTMGNGGLLFIVMTVIMLFFRATRQTGISCAFGMGLGFLITNALIKPIVSRPRPWTSMQGLEPLVSAGPYSFPSGHTCAAFAFAAAVCASPSPKWMKATALIAAALMGFSRLYVGVHFPSDVLAGALFGTACGIAGGAITKVILRHFGRRYQE